MVLHEQEWVVIKVTKELDFGPALIISMRMDRRDPSELTLHANSICNSGEVHVCRKTAQTWDERELSRAMMLYTYPRIEATHIPITSVLKLAPWLKQR